MAHPYTTRAKVRQQLRSAERATELHDANVDGTEDTIDDTSAYDDAISSACVTIDARLGVQFETPFAAVDDATPTPELITRICNFLVLWEGYSRAEPESVDAKYWYSRAEVLITGILAGSIFLDATRISATRRRRISYEAGPQYVAGNLCGDYTSRGVPRTRGI